jgi:dsRNA-specific ribonuclease
VAASVVSTSPVPDTGILVHNLGPERPLILPGDERTGPAPLAKQKKNLQPEDLPSPDPARAGQSAKLAALHARLNISHKVPLETLARALVDPSADRSPNFNNANLAFVGGTIIHYHTSEWLLCKYPRLPMGVMYEAMRAYAGPRPLHRVACQWGIESAAYPGGEVDPGLLQWLDEPGAHHVPMLWGYKRSNREGERRGMSSRVIYDDPFGDPIDGLKDRDAVEEENLRATGHKKKRLTDHDFPVTPTPAEQASAEKARSMERRVVSHSQFVRAVVGAIYAHAGRELARSFVRAHILSRTLDMASLFSFGQPLRELATLCKREGFDHPRACILSETGRMSRAPVYVVGIFSGPDKLAEGAGPSLEFARTKAAINALCAWYLYSPADHPRVPSDVLEWDGQRKWKAPHVDMGEIISN